MSPLMTTAFPGFAFALLLPSIALAQEPTKPAETPKLPQSADGETMRVFWKDGLRFESADKRYRVKIGGRIH